MARRVHAAPSSPEGRALAVAIAQGKRAGMTNAQIGATLGINERTVRKVRSGETPGTRTYRRLTKTPKVRPSPNTFNAEFVVGTDANGNEIVASRNIIVPDVASVKGRRIPTALDALQFQRKLQAMAAMERAALALRYGVTDPAKGDSRVRLRAVGRMRKPSVIITSATA